MSLRNIVACVLEQAVIILFFYRYFKMKQKSKIWLFAWLAILVFLVILLNRQLSLQEYYILIIPFVGILPFVEYLFYGRKLEKVLVSILVFEIIGIVSILVVYIFSFLIYKHIEVEKILEFHDLSVFCVRSFIFFLVSQLLAKQRSKVSGELTNSVLFCFMIMLCVSIVSTIAMESMMYEQRYRLLDSLMVVFGILILLINTLILYFTTLKLKGDEMKKELILQETVHRKDALNKIVEDEQKIRRLRHDLQHVLLSLNFYLSQRDFAKCKDIIEEYVALSLDKQLALISGNDFVNYILNYKFEEAKKQQVTISYHIANFHHYKISDVELGIILGNVIDNAIENTADQRVKVSLREIGGYLSIVVSNAVKDKVLEHNSSFRSIKIGEGHGYGIKSLQMLVHKNCGSIDICEENNIFKMSILVK